MDLKTQAVYVAALMACSLIASTEAITCYECESITESGCSDPFKSDGIDTCSSGNVCTKLKGSADGKSVVIRGCLYMLSPTNECKEETQSGVTGTLCVCTGDRCNNARSIIPSAWLLAVVSVLSMSAAIRK